MKVRSAPHAGLTLLLLLLLPLDGLPAQSVRGPLAARVTLAAHESAGIELRPGLGELVLIDVDETFPLLRGIELEVGIPPGARRAAGSFAIYAYADAVMEGEDGIVGAQGRRLPFELLTAARRIFFRLPTSDDHGFRTTADTEVFDRVLSRADFPVLLTIQAVMKGFPEEVLDETFTTTVRAIPTDRGGVDIEIIPPVADNIESERFLDGLVIELSGDRIQTRRLLPSDILAAESELLLEPGLYSLEIRGEDIRTERRTIGVERGTISEAVIELRPALSLVSLQAPENAEVLLNGAELGTNGTGRVYLEPGEHTIAFRIGDYTVSRRFSTEKERDYTISLSLDVLVAEETPPVPGE